MKKVITFVILVCIFISPILAQVTQQGTVKKNQLALWDSNGVLKAGYLSDYLSNNNGSIAFNESSRQFSISTRSISISDFDSGTSAEVRPSGGLYTYNDVIGLETRYTYSGITHFGISEFNLVFDENINSRDVSNKKVITIPNSTGTIALTNGENTTYQVPFWDAKGVLKSSDDLVVKNGNVGIGTNNPEEKLHIYGGTASIQGNIGTPTSDYWRTGSHSLELQNDDRGEVVLSFHRAGASNAAIVHPISGGLKFSGSGKPSDNHMFLSSSGKLGIGNLAPREGLDIGRYSAGAGRGLIVGEYFTVNERDYYNNATVIGFNARIDPLDKSKFIPTHAAPQEARGMLITMRTGGQADLDFYGTYWRTRESKSLNDFTHVMRIKTNGNIGIGTKLPQSKLHVADGEIRSDKGLVVTGAARLEKKGSNARLWATGNLEFGANGDQGNMVIRADTGNIGIGTTDPKGYKLGVNGKIAATEVKVALYNNWSDFVFEDDYQLPTLKEVETHIEEKGHLKDIPSAKEVAKDGFFLGEMDAKLLQKIEELTLYTIAQEKQLKSQNQKIELLLQRLEKLEADRK